MEWIGIIVNIAINLWIAYLCEQWVNQHRWDRLVGLVVFALLMHSDSVVRHQRNVRELLAKRWI